MWNGCDALCMQMRLINIIKQVTCEKDALRAFEPLAGARRRALAAAVACESAVPEAQRALGAERQRPQQIWETLAFGEPVRAVEEPEAGVVPLGPRAARSRH